MSGADDDRIARLREKIAHLPKTPGVYLMKDGRGRDVLRLERGGSRAGPGQQPAARGGGPWSGQTGHRTPPRGTYQRDSKSRMFKGNM